MLDISLVGVFLAALSAMVIAMIWYSPLIYTGRMWMKLGNVPELTPEEKKGMWKNMILAFLGSLVMAYVLAQFVEMWRTIQNGMTLREAFMLAFLSWLGFVAVVLLGQVLWEKRPWGYFLINAGYWFVGIFVMVSILAFI